MSLFPPAAPRVVNQTRKPSKTPSVFADTSKPPSTPPRMQFIPYDDAELLRANETLPPMDDKEFEDELRHLLGDRLYNALIRDDVFLLDLSVG